MSNYRYVASPSDDRNIQLVRVTCHCGESNLTDMSDGHEATEHKVRVGPVGGRVRLFCNKCQIEYVAKGVRSEVEVIQVFTKMRR